AARRARPSARDETNAPSVPRTNQGARPNRLSRSCERLSDDGVAPGCFTEPVGAELRSPLERVEVDVDEPEPVAVAVDPLEVGLRAPGEVAVPRPSFGGWAVELPEAGAQEHHPVRVVPPAVVGEHV